MVDSELLIVFTFLEQPMTALGDSMTEQHGGHMLGLKPPPLAKLCALIHLVCFAMGLRWAFVIDNDVSILADRRRLDLYV